LESLLLAEEILRHTPQSGLAQRPELTGEMQAASHSQSPYAFARTFYGITSLPEPPAQQGTFDAPLASAFENVVKINLSSAHGLSGASGESSPLRDVFSQSLLLLSKLVDGINSPIDVSWNPSEWLYAVLTSINHEVSLPLKDSKE
jgi:hypothetical protein